MSDTIVVHKGRTNIVTLDLGIDTSTDVITSEIRTKPEQSATLIATWVVTELTDGTDGKYVLRLDNTFSSQITVASGWMDIKRVSGGEPLSVFDEPLQVEFKGTVTA